MAHGDAREGKWRGKWWMEWVVSTLHTVSELGVSSITTADAHTSAASSRLNWRPCRFKWTRPFCRKNKSGFCACSITFQMQSTPVSSTKPSLQAADFSSTLPASHGIQLSLFNTACIPQYTAVTLQHCLHPTIYSCRSSTLPASHCIQLSLFNTACIPQH